MPPHRRRPKLLSSTRPSRITKSTIKPATTPSSLSSKKGRTLIRAFHNLQKQHAAALSSSETARVTELEKQMQELGGLKAYQAASLNGQRRERGGDSSAVLVGWLGEGEGARGRKRKRDDMDIGDGNEKEVQEKEIRVLEIGCLSPHNAISKLPTTHMTRLDLHSQDPLIEEQDFMQRPIPANEAEKFDIVSLSLVLNYVPDAIGKGDMLRRVCEFLKCPARKDVEDKQEEKERGRRKVESTNMEQAQPAELSQNPHPTLFLVLPGPCILNSRYMSEAHLTSIMHSLGFRLLRRKLSSKLVYYLWRWDGWGAVRRTEFGKRELHPGGARNNFCVVIR